MKTLETILLATDLQPASREAAEAAARLARRFGSRVTLLRVLEPVPGWPDELPRQFTREAGPLRGQVEQLASRGVVVAESAVAFGPVVDTILGRAEEVNADLILIGAGERSAADRFAVGPVAQAVLERAPRPVLAVRPGEPAAAFRKVLCAVDHSAASRRGLQNAARLAQAFDGELAVLTVVPPVPWLLAAVETGHLAHAGDAHARKWQEEFEQFLKGVDFNGARWSAEVRHGAPHEEVLAAARAGGADVLVMGATGRTGLARALLGGVTRRVLRDLPCSLLAVQEEDLAAERFENEVRAVSVLMGQGRGLLAAQSYAAAAAKFRRALTHTPFHVPALEGLADALRHLGREDEAGFYRWRAGVLRGEGWA
jgi:nucleotide-binding universal stress UspA family protein